MYCEYCYWRGRIASCVSLDLYLPTFANKESHERNRFLLDLQNMLKVALKFATFTGGYFDGAIGFAVRRRGIT